MTNKGATLAVLLALDACALPPSPSVPLPAAKPVALVQADLANAITIAAAAGPQGALIVQCFTYLQGQLAALKPLPASGGGVATAFTVADLALNNLGPSLIPVEYYTACGPLVLQVTNRGLTMQAQLAGLVGLIAK